MRNLIPYLLLFLGVCTSAQDLQLTGKAVDEKNMPISYADVTLSVGDSIIKSELTKEDGTFEISAPQGNYTLTLKQLGEVLYSQNIDLIQDIDLGTLKIQQAKELQMVTVTGEKKLIERKVDRLVFNVENSVAATGGDALDALKVTPGLRVQNDQIFMIGKSSMSVMIDDRLVQLSGDDLTNYLKSIPSDNIKSIEVITTPPAKYDAEGNSGLINIQLKKARANSWNAYLAGGYKQFKYASFDENAGLKYNKNKLSLYADVSHNDGVYLYRTENEKIYYPDKFYNSLSKMNYDYRTNINANAGLDYDFSSKFSAGFQYMYNYDKKPLTDNNNTKIYASPNNLIQTFADAESMKRGNTLNFHSTYKLDTLGGKMDLNLDYFDYQTNSDRTFQTKEYENFTDYTDGSYDAADNGSLLGIKNYSAKIDVEQPLHWFKLSYGGRLSFTRNNSSIYYYDCTNGTPVFQTNRSDDFVYDEDLQALYVSGNKKMGKWETQAGLRMENTQTKGTSQTLQETDKNNYLKIFPTLYIKYSPNEDNSLSFNYSKRVSRPVFSALNPFVRYVNPYSTTQGNPFLQPSYTHNLELDYTYKDNWNTSLFFSKTVEDMRQITFVSTDNNNNIYSATKYENYGNSYSIGISESYTFKKIKWWESVNSGSFFYTNIQSHVTGFTGGNGWGAFLESDNTFTLNTKKTFFLSLDGWYFFPQYEALDKIDRIYEVNAGFKALLLKKQLTIDLYFEDVFNSTPYKVSSVENGIPIVYNNSDYRKSIRLSIKYTFGNQNIKSKKTQTGNAEERQRAN